MLIINYLWNRTQFKSAYRGTYYCECIERGYTIAFPRGFQWYDVACEWNFHRVSRICFSKEAKQQRHPKQARCGLEWCSFRCWCRPPWTTVTTGSLFRETRISSRRKKPSLKRRYQLAISTYFESPVKEWLKKSPKSYSASFNSN